MIIQTEYRWNVTKEGDEYLAVSDEAQPFTFRFRRDGEAFDGVCERQPPEPPKGFEPKDIAALYSRVARDAGDAVLEYIRKERIGNP